ncbi:MAG TPA: tripartite tricarboxylate transporter substrate binding protein [Burkholderiales bacterium]|nr:tripartite tricarboxylate transporter substrate binding protein [Burkholderiales bacterium]
MKRLLKTSLKTSLQTLTALGLGLTALHSAGQQFPSRALTLVCPYGAGSGSDIISRVVADHLSKSIGQNVIAENRPGASAMIGHDYVARSAPDGYTLMITGDQLSTLPIFFKDWKHDLKDFTLVAMPYTATVLMMTGGNQPYKNMAEFLTYAKANPGKVNYAFVGPGPYVVAFRYMNKVFDLGMTEISYKGTADARSAAMRNELHLFPDTLAGTLGMIQQGQLRPMATIKKTRMDALPDVPTVNEGALAPLKLDADETWTALAGPAGLPRDVVARLNTAMNTAAKTPEFIETMRKFGVTATTASVAEVNELAAKDMAKWAGIAKTIGMVPQ